MPLFKEKELQWVKLDPKNPELKYGSQTEHQWSLDVLVDGEEAMMWVDKGFATKRKEVKDRDGTFSLKLKRPTIWKKSGKDKDPVKVMDVYGDPVDPATIGNGTVANVQYSVYDWEFQGRKGQTAELQAIQIIKLEKFEGTNSAGDEFSFAAKKEVSLEDSVDLSADFD